MLFDRHHVLRLSDLSERTLVWRFERLADAVYPQPNVRCGLKSFRNVCWRSSYSRWREVEWQLVQLGRQLRHVEVAGQNVRYKWLLTSHSRES